MNKSSKKSGHFLICEHTIGLLFAASGVGPCWRLERMQEEYRFKAPPRWLHFGEESTKAHLLPQDGLPNR